MKRHPVNPRPWSLKYGYNQGEIVENPSRVLYCAGQGAFDTDGHLQHASDMGGQIALALDNLEAVLSESDMALANVVRLVIYTTDVDLLTKNFYVLAARLRAAGVMPPQTLLGVARLGFPEMMVELEATAVS